MVFKFWTYFFLIISFLLIFSRSTKLTVIGLFTILFSTNIYSIAYSDKSILWLASCLYVLSFVIGVYLFFYMGKDRVSGNSTTQGKRSKLAFMTGVFLLIGFFAANYHIMVPVKIMMDSTLGTTAPFDLNKNIGLVVVLTVSVVNFLYLYKDEK